MGNRIVGFDDIRQIFAETLEKSTSYEDWMIRIVKEIHYIGFNDGMLAQAAHDKLLVEEGYLIPREDVEEAIAEISNLKGDNFPNSYYVKILRKHIGEAPND